MACFNYNIHYKPGKFNRHADALSRYLVEHPSENVDLGQEDLEVALILSMAASSFFLWVQQPVPQDRFIEIHTLLRRPQCMMWSQRALNPHNLLRPCLLSGDCSTKSVSNRGDNDSEDILPVREVPFE